MKKNKRLFFLIFAIIAAAALGVWYFIPSKTQKVPYKIFYQDAGEGKISSVTINPEEITFSYIGGESTFKTDNPDSSSLKEYLLLNNIEVKESKGIEEILTLIFDSFFYIIFAVIFIAVFRKFISPNTFKTVHKTGVSFKNIVGMDGLKKDMLQIADIMKHPAQYKAKGIRMPKGILLEGAPGNGKTLFARALAGEAKVNFIPAKATDFESMFMAIGPMKVKLLFKKARRQAPCIVFIDEFDGIGTKRNYSGSAIETENTRIVTALLNELDGFTPNDGILVLAATNSRQALDEALIRPGRFDAKYTVPYPDLQDRETLIQMYSNGKSFDPGNTPKELARLFNGFSCAQIESLLNRAALICSQDGRSSISPQDIQSAMKEM